MIADVLSNKKLNSIVTDLFFRGKKLNISLVFVTKSYFTDPRSRISSTHYFIISIPNKQEFQQVRLNHLSDIDFKDFMNFYKKYTAKPYFHSVTDANLAWDNLVSFKKILSERI